MLLKYLADALFQSDMHKNTYKTITVNIIFIWPLFNQESPIEIKNLFFEGVLAKRQQQITYINSQYYTHNI